MGTEIASAFVSLIPSFKGGQAAISRELSGVSDSAGRESGRRFGKVFASASIAPLRAIGAAAVGLFAIDKAAGFMKDALGAASDLNETMNKSSVIFGSSSKQIQIWAETAATSLGLSKQQAIESAASFGDMFSQLGLGRKDAASTSKQIVGLAADLGSFNNLGTDDVLERIAAGFRGEYDSLQTLIPNINAARVEQEALSRTHKSSAKDLTALEKAQATLAIIQHDGARAQGDFARTSNGAANQQKILAAQTENLKARLGGAFLPVLTAVQGALIKASPALTGLAGNFADLATGGIAKVSALMKQAKPYIDAFMNGLSGGSVGGSGPFATLTNIGKTIRDVAGQVVSFGKRVGSAFATLGGPLKTFGATVLPVLQQIGSQIMAVVGPALKQIGSIITGQVVPALRAFLPAVAPIAAFLLKLFGSAIIGALKGVVNVVKGVLTVLAGVFNIFAGIFTGNWSKVWQGIKQVASGIWSAIRGAFQVFINVGLGRVFKLGGALLGKIGKGIWTGLSKLFSAGTKAVGSIVSRGVSAVVKFFAGLPGKALGVLRSLAGRLGRLFTGALNRARSAVSTGIGKVLGKLREIPGRAASALANLGKTLYHAGAALIGGLVNGIRDKAGSAVRAAKGVVSDAVSAAKRLLGIRSPSRVFAEIGGNIGQGLVLGMLDQRRNVAAAAQNLAQTTLTPMQRAAAEMLKQIRGGGAFFEDFSFRGNSANVRKFSEQIADKFYGSHRDFDFGAPGTTAEVEKFLEGLLRRRANVARPAGLGSSLTGGTGATQVRVFIGNKELTDIVRVEIGETNRTTRRRVMAGTGAAW